MPMQEQPMSSFAKRLGARVAAANAQYRDKPPETGQRRLPSGIKDGVAKLSSMYTKESDNDNGKTPKGQVFFRASATVLGQFVNGQFTKEHKGQDIVGIVTQVVIPMCDVPEKGDRKAESFDDNYNTFRSLLRILGVPEPPYDPTTDPTGILTEQYYFAAMKALTDPKRPQGPVFISFKTRGWVPPKTPQRPDPEEFVFEDWLGLADMKRFNAAFDPATAGVRDHAQGNGTAPPNLPPSAPSTQTFATTPPITQTPLLPPATAAPAPQGPDLADEIAALVEVALGDPEGATPDGAEASARLEELAWQAGATKEQTGQAKDWAQVGEMALGIPAAQVLAANAPPAAAPPPAAPATPTVGSRWLFAKRTKDGSKLKNAKGEEFPPQEVEVTAVDAAAKSVFVKTTRDGKDVVDIRSKQPVAVKWEWLEALPY